MTASTLRQTRVGVTETVWSVKPEKCTMWLFTEKKVPIPGLEHLDLGFSETSQARCCQGEAWSSQTWAMPALGTVVNKSQNLLWNVGVNCESRFRADNFF